MRKLIPLLILILCAVGLIIILCGFKAHDGDTLTRISYRMAYIDAPELDQTCHIDGKQVDIGWESQKLLKKLSKRELVGCRVVEMDKYHRAVVDCGYNLTMVREGMAVCYDKYMTPDEQKKCHVEQDYAEENDFGLWQCEDFVTPSVYRHGSDLNEKNKKEILP